MGILQKVMSSIGIGAIRVELIPQQQEYRLGEEIRGHLVIFSGDSDHTVENVYVRLRLDARQGNEHIVRIVHTVYITERLTVQAHSPQREFCFAFPLPYYIPVSANHIRYTLSVCLDIKNALNPCVVKTVQIKPSLEMEAVLGALERIGFVTKPDSGEMEHDHQKFAFYPTKFMRGKMEELEIMFNQNKNNLFIYLEIDRKARGLAGLFKESMIRDEKHSRFTVPSSELVTGGRPNPEGTARLLAAFIEQAYNKTI